MKWEGNKLKDLSQSKGITLTKLSEKLEVSRQTVNDWINGQIPKGNHLLALCRMFDIDPGYLFSPTSDILIPAHRTRKTAKINPMMQKESLALAEKYVNLFKNNLNYKLIPVNRLDKRSKENAKMVASQLRQIVGISDDKPMDYKNTFQLLDKLGIHVIFTEFPSIVKSYAFYTEINNHRVIFVNSNTNILDLIFPLLHETIHAIRDEGIFKDDLEEEIFCDSVASHLQFPEGYANLVYKTISDLPPGAQVIKLKNFASTYGHSLLGIVGHIEKYVATDFVLNVGGADTKLKKEFPSIGKVIYEQKDLSQFINALKTLSPNFMELLFHQIGILSDSKLAEIFNLDIVDAKEVKNELYKTYNKILNTK